MEKIKNTADDKRNLLITKLIGLDKFKIKEKQLYELSLSELEYEYFKSQYCDHPHGGHGSIRWKNF
ncbi:Fur-regulated basic protein FbpA [Neobacillus notoginsengisoli]|uniref:Fur-regulated basic protein FbpA n=1 Tax=Neobacillus notoginsengisoli TaxID=1578198 RepID=A0A417Z093_9BACI|nr:Fur-regulated basic protein FbpA [Neobacillus notoginsengisoli]RHW43456.1 Fur-regulated basic protein FbpA [Neobacillus notoginsengisoli]